MTPMLTPAVRSSQVARDERCNHAEDSGHRPGKSPERRSRDLEDLPARRAAGGDGMRPRGCDRAPLTWSEVEARRDPCRFCCHQRQQKPWRARSCSSISLPPRGNSTNGEPLSEALLRWPTKTNRVRWSPRVDAPTESHTPVAGKPAAPRPRCTRLLLARYRGRQPVATLRATKYP